MRGGVRRDGRHVIYRLEEWEPNIEAVAADGSKPGIDFEDLDQQQDFWIHEGMVPSRTNIRQFVDTRYLDAALAQQR